MSRTGCLPPPAGRQTSARRTVPSRIRASSLSWTMFSLLVMSKNSVLLEDLPDAGALTQDVTDDVLARRLLEGAADHLLLDCGRHHDDAVFVGQNEVAVPDTDASRQDWLP